jgi:transcriptional regulator of heat shock response
MAIKKIEVGVEVLVSTSRISSNTLRRGRITKTTKTQFTVILLNDSGEVTDQVYRFLRSSLTLVGSSRDFFSSSWVTVSDFDEDRYSNYRQELVKRNRRRNLIKLIQNFKESIDLLSDETVSEFLSLLEPVKTHLEGINQDVSGTK